MEVKVVGQPEAAKLEKETTPAPRFTGTLVSYDPDPAFMLHLDKAKMNDEDLPKEKAPAKKPPVRKPAAKKPRPDSSADKACGNKNGSPEIRKSRFALKPRSCLPAIAELIERAQVLAAGGTGAVIELVFADFAAQGVAVNAEHFCGAALVALRAFQGALDEAFFEFAQRFLEQNSSSPPSD